MRGEAKPIEVKADLPPRDQMPMPAAPRWLDMLPDAQGMPFPIQQSRRRTMRRSASAWVASSAAATEWPSRRKTASQRR